MLTCRDFEDFHKGRFEDHITGEEDSLNDKEICNILSEMLGVTSTSKPSFTVDEIEEYLQGWLTLPHSDEAFAAIANGLSQLRCGEDGLEAETYYWRKKYLEAVKERDEIYETYLLAKQTNQQLN